MILRTRAWPAEIDFDFCSTVPSRSGEALVWRDDCGPLTISRIDDSDGPRYRLRLGDVSVIDVLADRRFIVYRQAGAAGAAHEHFLADQAVPRAMAHEGSFVIHAGAVQVGDGAILLLGSSGRGKSTLATSFDQAGFALLGDDAMIISSLGDNLTVRPVYPSLRLFPDSIDALMLDAGSAGSVAPYTTKRRFDVLTSRCADDPPLPIHTIFSIAGNAEDGEVSLRELSQAEACMALVEGSFALDPSDTGRARGRLHDASELAGQVPAFEISYPRDYARLPEVRQAIFDRVAALEAA